MKRSTRTFLFIMFVGLFLITTPLIISYSQGYRIDWQNRGLVQTGALFLEPRPAPVELFINGNLKKKSSFVFQNIFVGNLIPKAYGVKIEKLGYTTWQKNLIIAPKLVTEAKNIVLFPRSESAPINEIKSGLKNFFASPDGKYFVFVGTNSIPSISLYSPEKQAEIIVFSSPPEFMGYEIGNIQWNKDSTGLIFSLEKNEQKRWVHVNLAEPVPKSADLSQNILGMKDFAEHTKKMYRPAIDRIRWHSGNSREIFFIAKDNYGKYILFSYNAEIQKLSKPLAYDVLEYSQEGNEIFYISALIGNINRLDLNTGQIYQASFSQIFDPRKGASTSIISAKNPYIIILSDGILYYFDKRTASLKKISDSEHVSATEDGGKFLYVDKNVIGVYWIKDIRTQPFRNAGDSEIITISNELVRDAVWFSKNNEYIIFSTENAIKAIELDGRDERNISTLLGKPAQKIFYEKKDEALYFLSNDTLYFLSLR